MNTRALCIKVKLRKAKGLKHCVRILTGLEVNVHRHQRKPTNRIRNDVLTFTPSLTFVPAFLKGGSIGELHDEVSLCGMGEPGCHQQEMPPRCQNRNSRVFIMLTDTAPYAQTDHYWKQWLRLRNARKDLECKGSALVSSTIFAKEKGEERKRGACLRILLTWDWGLCTYNRSKVAVAPSTQCDYKSSGSSESI